MSTVDDLLRELAGPLCRCGRPKRTRETFCASCYHRLPTHLRRALYQRIGQGYEEAYEAAIDYLDNPRGVNGGSPR